MAKRATAIPKFNPNQTLKSIRENSLNPVIDQLFAVETNIDTVIVPTQQTVYKNVIFNETTRKLHFTPVGHDADPAKYPIKDIDLTSIVPIQAGITVKGYTKNHDATFPGSGSVDNTSDVRFEDGTISKDALGFANVKYEWDKIVPAYQRNDTVSIAGTTPATGVYDKLEIHGPGASEYFTYTSLGSKAGTVRIDMPLIPEVITASVYGKPLTDVKIDKIHITGEVGGSTIDGTTLQIDLPTGSGKFAVGHFKGFYNRTDDIPTEGLIEDRSSAYIRMEKDGVIYYILHMYHESTWKPVGTVPSIIYKGKPGEPDQGVRSIKNNDYITINAQGELDLDGLGTHGGGGSGTGGNDYFMGIYDTVDEIKAIASPTANKSYAILRNATAKNGYLPYSYREVTSGSGDPQWRLTPTFGHLMSVTGTATSPENYTPIYGIKGAGSNWKISTDGVLQMAKYPKGTIGVSIQGIGGVPSQFGDIKNIRYSQGSSNVFLNPDGLLDIYPAQTVITKLTDDWQDLNKTENFLGKIYFDKSTSKWIGMSDKDADKPWAPILHKGMSDQITDLNYRLPPETPIVTPAAEEDDRWKYSGNTYLEKDDESLPTEIKSVCGGFIQTDIKEDSAIVDIAQKVRTQICHADDGSGKIFMRAYDTTATPSKWKPWVRTSYSSKDMEAHKGDPGAHKSVFKHYRLLALRAKYQELVLQNLAGSGGGVFGTNVHTLADNYGYSSGIEDFLSVPYNGKFRIGGVVSFGGYKEGEKKFPTGRWQVVLRKRDIGTSNYSPVLQTLYQHTDESKPYPSMHFKAEGVDLLSHQELIANFTFTDNAGLKEKHPDLYVVPTRSYIYVEDNLCRAASFMGNSHRVLYGNLDVIGDVGVKAHHTTINNPSSTIRVFGEIVNKTPVDMTPINP